MAGRQPLHQRFRRRPRQRRLGRLSGMSLANLIPNMMTVAALCAGLTAIRFGVEDRFHEAVLFVVLAGVFDGLDGRLARMLNSTSKLGAELDSLADLVSFGVAPALILYSWAMQGAGVLGWLPMLLLAVCAALRLARFNVMMGSADLPAYAYNYFVGVPAPAAAAVALMPLMLSFEIGPGWASSPWLVGGWAVMVGGLMVSTLPTFSFKRLKIPQQSVFFVLIAMAVLATLLLTRTWLALVGIGVVYLATIPVSIWRYNLLKTEAERLQADEDDQPAADPPPPAS